MLNLIRDELRITSHNSFGFYVDPAVLAGKMSEHVVLREGPDPFFIRSESRDDIVGISRKHITILGMHRGFILSCGGGAAPGQLPCSCLGLCDEGLTGLPTFIRSSAVKVHVIPSERSNFHRTASNEGRRKMSITKHQRPRKKIMAFGVPWQPTKSGGSAVRW